MNCPVCGSAARHSAKLDNGYKLGECVTCALLFAYPRPTLEQLKAVYEPPPPGVFTDCSPEESRKVGLEYQKLMNSTACTGKKVLEVACNTGFALYGLQQLGYEVTGTDLSESTIRFGREHYGLRRLYCSEFPPAGEAGMYDVVIASHIIEHVISPRDFVAQCARFLKP